MSDEWTADIGNDPRYGYALCVELWRGGEHRMTIRRSKTGLLVLEIYPRSEPFELPAKWLGEVLARAERELPVATQAGEPNGLKGEEL